MRTGAELEAIDGCHNPLGCGAFVPRGLVVIKEDMTWERMEPMG